jgi:hypothetical protein
VGKAEICCHEPEETGNVEVESRLPPFFYHNKRPYIKKEPLLRFCITGVL